MIRKFRVFCLCLLIAACSLFFSGLPGTVHGQDPNNWCIATIDTVAGGNTEIAIDTHNRAHISYSGPSADLRYADNLGGSWSHRVVYDSWVSVARENAIALDASDLPQISFSFDDGHDENLMFAHQLGSGDWSVSTVASAESQGMENDIALDDQGAVHISHWKWNNNGLQYSTNASGDWTTVELAPAYRDRTAISVDHDGFVHIVYSYQSGLHYLTNRSGGWMDTLIASGPTFNSPAIAIDKGNFLHISYHSNGSLNYITNASGAWEITTIGSGLTQGYNHSIAVDHAGFVHVSYYDSSQADLLYVTNASGEWVTTTVDSDDDVGMGNSIAVDRNNIVHISYQGGGALKYATNACEPPLAADDSFETDEDVTLEVPAPGVLANDSDPYGYALTASLVPQPISGTLSLEPDGSFVYTPTLDTFGTNHFTYIASDGILTDTGVVTITIKPINDPPIAFDDTYILSQGGASYLLNVLENDTDPDKDSLTITSVGQPDGGGSAVNEGTGITYTPTALHIGGHETFQYIVSDGVLTDTAAVTVELTPLRTYLPLVYFDYCMPRIWFTYVPEYRHYDMLQGAVACVDYAEYRVAVYIYVAGWWTKPTFSQPLTPIQPDGTWVTNITTGGNDQLATKIAAFLVPVGYSPPPLAGASDLPPELYVNSAAYVIVNRPPSYRTIDFAGYTWNVKQSDNPVGPGPNYFSDSIENVWVDAAGLHLKITYRNGHWYCGEVILAENLGYGQYIFKLASPIDQLDPNVVLGLFTWDDAAPQYHYREIDLEFSRWGDASGQNAQFVVQPWDYPGNRHQFNMTLIDNLSTHWFDWSASNIQFASSQGGAYPPLNPLDIIESWTYTGPDIPPAGGENARMNLWLLNGNPPIDGQEVEVIIQSFTFLPSVIP